MGFLAPLFLAGLVGVGLPLWLHMLRQHKQTPLPFSSLMLFERRTQSSIKHRRLRYFLLLALRLAIVTLLALAFANPYMKRDPKTAVTGQKLVVLAIDQSFSMRRAGLMEKAKNEALAALGKVGGADKAQVLSFDSIVHQQSQQTASVEEHRAGIAAIDAADGKSSFGELARFLKLLGQGSAAPLEVHLFSDMQKTSMPPGFADLALADRTKLVFHAVATQTAQPNWTVESVSAPGRIFEPKKVRIQATVAGFNTPAAAKKVSLVAAGRTLETKSVAVPANGRTTVEFLTFEAPYGYTKAEIQVEGGDSFPNDDRFLFAVERSDPRKVLFLHDARSARSALFFKTAVESAANAAYIVDSMAAEQSSALALAKYAFVVLSDVAVVSPAVEDNLKKYAQGGGSVWITLGSSAAARGTVPVIAARIDGSRYAARGGERFQAIASFDAAHPSMRRTNGWEGVRFYQVIPIDLSNGDATKGKVIAKLADGTPVLSEVAFGSGRVLVFGSTLDNIANDFPVHAAFVPFVEETSRYLAREQESTAAQTVGSHLQLRAGQDQGGSVEVLDPRGARALTLEQASKSETMQLPSEGYYEVRRANGRQQLVAVNADRLESNLDVVTDETRALWQNTGQGGEAGGQAAGVTEESKPLTFWWYLVFLLLVAAMAESVYASRYLARDTGDDEIVRDGIGKKEAA